MIFSISSLNKNKLQSSLLYHPNENTAEPIDEDIMNGIDSC